MLEIYHVSDLHIGKRTRQAQRLLDWMQEKFRLGEDENRYLLVTGDITQDGAKKQYKRALKALEPFAGKVLISPGNHDYGFLGFVYSKRSAQNFDNLLASGVKMDHLFYPKIPFLELIEDEEGNRVLLIGLNSCSQTKTWMDLAKGEIGEAQLNDLNRLLEDPAYQDIPKIVFLHHIPHRRAQGFKMSLKDYKALMDAVENRVMVLSFGHQGSLEDVTEEKAKKRKLGDEALKELKEFKETNLPIRAMRLRRGPAHGIKYYLDANEAVMEAACYRMKVKGGDILASLIRKPQ
jgi:hypothetical protein